VRQRLWSRRARRRAAAAASRRDGVTGWSSASTTRSSRRCARRRAGRGCRGARTPRGQLLREALAELVRCAGQVRKIGTNLNQAVAKLNATGQSDRDLVDAAEQVRKAAIR
jgi:hypothetical protein